MSDGLNIFDLPDAPDAPAQDGSAPSGGAPASPAPEPNGEAGGDPGPGLPQDAAPPAGEGHPEGQRPGVATDPDASPAGTPALQVVQVNGRPYEVGSGPGQIPPEMAAAYEATDRQKREFQARADKETARLDRIERENERLRQQLGSQGTEGQAGQTGAPERPEAGMTESRMQDLLSKARQYDEANGYDEGEGYGALFGQMIEQFRAERANGPDAQDTEMVRSVARRERIEQDYEALEQHMESRDYDLDEEVLIATQGGGGERVALREAVRRYYLGAEAQLREQGVDDRTLSQQATRHVLMQRALVGASEAAYMALRSRAQGGQISAGQQPPGAVRPPLAPPGVAGQASTPRGQAPGAAGPASRGGLEVEVVDGDGQAVPGTGPTGDRIDMIAPLE